jgi:serine/threonine protein kinase
VLAHLRESPLEHPAIIPVLAAGSDGHLVWLAEPWFDGTPLDVLMQRDAAQSPAEVLVRIAQLAGALDFAAAVDLHHGALHPRDVLVSGEVTAVAGIGVLQALGDAGLVVPMEGAYVAPQRARGLSPTRSDDVFALAAIAYELLYAAPVPARSELRALVTPLAGVDRARLADALHRALSPEPDDRPSTALEFAGAIQTALTPIPVPIPDSDSEVPLPTLIREPESHPEIAIAHSDAARASVPDLPLRAAEPKVAAESLNQHRNVESEFRNRNSESESPNQEPASESQFGYWFLATASLAIGLLMGFSGGYVVGQRDAIPVSPSAPRVAARTQPPPPSAETPAPTAGRDFTESAVPPGAREVERPAQSVPDQPVVPRPESGDGTGRNDRSQSDRLDPREPGVLQVDSRPRGAQVFVNGRLVGTTPLLLPDISPGTHAVRIDLRGHRRWVASVDVAPGQRQRVAASLER